MMKEFEKKYKLDMNEDQRSMFDPNGYAKNVLQIGSIVKYVVTIEGYWTNCKDEIEIHDQAFMRLHPCD